MSTQHKFILKPYDGRKTRFECPQCHDRQSFVPYVNAENGVILDPSCGRCNHECGCGYHYTPSQYFRDNGWRVSPTYQRPQQSQFKTVVTRQIEKADKPLDTIPFSIVRQYFDNDYQSTFARWLLSIFEDRKKVENVLLKYWVGCLPDGRTIFWQLDENYQCRCGKTIQYKQNGHRVKTGDPEMIGSVEVSWMHSRLKKEGVLPEDWTMTQSLFGAHHLPYDKRQIGIVEAEKTALIMSIVDDHFLWIACGGLGQFSELKMKVLQGREVVLFPDQGCHEKWETVKEKLSKYCKCAVSNVLRNDESPKHKGCDIADLVVEQLTN